MFIEVDLSTLAVGHSVHVRDLVMPAGVTPVLHAGENPTVVTVASPGGAAGDEGEAGAAPAGGEAKPAA